MKNKKEVIVKIDPDLVTYEPKRGIKNALFIIADVIILLLVAFFVVGYINFVKIKDQKEPVFVINEKNYNIGTKTKITVYDNMIYKIVKQENKDTNIIYSLKLWFMDEVE